MTDPKVRFDPRCNIHRDSCLSASSTTARFTLITLMSISLSAHDIDDELDLLSAPISRVRISSATENSSAPLRRSGRARQSSSRLPATITSASISSKPKLKKRKSAPAVAESEASEPLAKKQKSHVRDETFSWRITGD